MPLFSGSEGPPVLLFPSLAGSVLESQASPVKGFGQGTRVWMALSSLMARSSGHKLTVVDTVSSGPDTAQVSSHVPDQAAAGEPRGRW